MLEKRDKIVLEGDVFDDQRLLELVNYCKDDLLEVSLREIKGLINYFGIHAFVSIY